MLAQYIGAITQLKKEIIQLKMANNNQEKEIAHLKSEVSIKDEPTSDIGLKQFVCVRYA